MKIALSFGSKNGKIFTEDSSLCGFETAYAKEWMSLLLMLNKKNKKSALHISNFIIIVVVVVIIILVVLVMGD